MNITLINPESGNESLEENYIMNILITHRSNVSIAVRPYLSRSSLITVLLKDIYSIQNSMIPCPDCLYT